MTNKAFIREAGLTPILSIKIPINIAPTISPTPRAVIASIVSSNESTPEVTESKIMGTNYPV